MTWWQKKPYIDAIHAYDKISDREQKIVLATFVTLLLLLTFLLLIEPLLLTAKSLYSEKAEMQAASLEISTKIKKTLAKQHLDPNDALHKELATLSVESDKYQEQIGLLTQALVAPKQMVSLLENVLTQDKQLKLISLNNLPEQGMNLNQVSREENLTNAESDFLIYKHGFEIELETTYDSSIAYLKRLDALPWQLFWQTLEYESTQYPKGKLKIRIYTLSMSKAVLGV
jgi:MSHA biogenesis protein MshJ